MLLPAARIVLVSDDDQLRLLVCGLLIAHGYHGVVGVDIRSASALERLGGWDIAVVDTSVSRDDAIRVLRQLKSASAATVAIFPKRTGAAMPREVMAGTDVLLGKPFDPRRELLLVIRGMLDRRSHPAPDDNAPVAAGPIVLSTLLSHATIASREIELTGVEARILRELMVNANRAVTREQLLRRALLREGSPDTRSLDTISTACAARSAAINAGERRFAP